MTKDHIVPKYKGGPSSLENYQTMCEQCNGVKGCGIEIPALQMNSGPLFDPLEDRFYLDLGIPSVTELARYGHVRRVPPDVLS